MQKVTTDSFVIVYGKNKISIYKLDENYQKEKEPSMKEQNVNIEKMKLQETKKIAEKKEPGQKPWQENNLISSRLAAAELQAEAVNDNR